MLTIEPVACLSDNYAYLIHDFASGLCAVVDPSEPLPVKNALAKHGWKLTHILNTHHHFDHTGGNLALKEEFGADVVGPGKDRERIPGIDTGVDESAPWTFGAHSVRVLEIPAHTRAHIAFVFDDEKAVFTGDTLFSMGCGRLFEGTPAMMWASSFEAHDARRRHTRLLRPRIHDEQRPLRADPRTRQSRSRRTDERRRGAQSQRRPDDPLHDRRREENQSVSPARTSREIRQTLGMASASDVDVFAETRRRKDNF